MNSAKIILIFLVAGVVLVLLFPMFFSGTPQTTAPPSAAPKTMPAIQPQPPKQIFVVNAYRNAMYVYEGIIPIAGNRMLGEYLAERGVHFNRSCIAAYCIGVNKSLSFYVNDRWNDEFEKYVPKDQDIILIWFIDKSNL